MSAPWYIRPLTRLTRKGFRASAAANCAIRRHISAYAYAFEADVGGLLPDGCGTAKDEARSQERRGRNYDKDGKETLQFQLQRPLTVW